MELVVKIKALQGACRIAWGIAALIVFNFTSGCGGKAWTTFTDKGILGALAGAAILTGLINTVINCVLAFLACEARLADTGEAIHLIHTSPAILARIDGTVINVDITVLSSPARLARALITE